MAVTLIKNGKVITPFRMLKDGYVVFEDGIIREVGTGEPGALGAHETVDAGGMYVSPGFIDIHTHGGGGYDYMDNDVESFHGAARTHLCFGTTTIVPTTLTSTNEELKLSLETFKKAKYTPHDGAYLHGLHLEGPYFSMANKGAQDPRYIRDPKPEEYNEILSWSDEIVRWSIAPELPGALALGRELRRRGIVASAGHTDAECCQGLEAFENGFTLLTHFYSAMQGCRRINAFRHAGMVEAGYLMDECDVEIIADGCHLPEDCLRLIYQTKGAQHICLITDSLRPAGTDVKESIIGSKKNGNPVIIEDGVAKLPDRTAFAGSIATTNRLVRNMVELADVPLTQAVRMASATPARVMGMTNKGRIAADYQADILFFDQNIDIAAVYLNGELKFSK